MTRKLQTLLQTLAVTAIFGLITSLGYAQSGNLSGSITDFVTGEQLPGATVLISELERGAPADIDGNYEIQNIPVGTYNVRYSFIGYATLNQEVTSTEGDNIVNIQLRPDQTGLDEVVVTGIASRTSKAISEVAVSRVDATQYTASQSYQDLSQLISGKVAGVNVQPTGGTVGAGIRFNVRSGGGIGGSGQPVIYVDGIRIDNSQLSTFYVGGQGTGTLADINMDEVESINFLKGPAAAALYGTSGSNGVVLITTKRGQALSGAGSLSVKVRTTQGTSDYNRTETFDQFGSTEAIKDVFKEGTLDQKSISVAGGSEFIRFYTSVDQRNETGIMNRNYMDRQNFRANIDAFPREDLTISVSTGYAWNEVALPDNDNNIVGYLGNTILAGPGPDADGNLAIGQNTFGFTALESIESINDVSRTNRFLGSLSIQYRPIKNFELNASVGFDGSDLRRDATVPPGFFVVGPGTIGERAIANRSNEQYTYDISARYQYSVIEGLNATTTVGSQLFDRNVYSQNFTKQNFSTPLITNIGAGEDFIAGDEGFLNTREAGVFFEQSFNFEDTFMLSFGGRQDFAAAIGGDAPNIFYPKASAAVRLDRALQLPSLVNFLKVRAAYGETGLLPGFNDGATRLWEAANSAYGTGGVINFIGNTQIKPERIKELELGVETELFNNSLSLDLTYYSQKSEDSIIDFREAPSTGTANLIPFNVGSIEGNGLEAALSYTPIQNRNTQLTFNVTYSYQDTEVTSLGGAQPIFDGFSLNVIEEGIRRSEFYVPRVIGVLFDDDGLYAGVDATAEREAVGNPIPVHSGSFSSSLQVVKNLTAYIQFDFAYDLYVYNNTKQFSILFRNLEEYEILRRQLGFSAIGYESVEALEVGTAAYNEAAEAYAAINPSYDYNFIERADWLKLRELSITYNFRDILSQFGADAYVKDLSFSVGGRNLWTSTKYSGLDPEVNFAGARSLSRGQDFLTLPTARQVYFTVSLGF